MADFVTERYRKVALSIFEIIMFLCLIITFLGSQYSNADQDKFTVDIPQPEKNVFSTDEIVRINFLVKNHLNATRNAAIEVTVYPLLDYIGDILYSQNHTFSPYQEYRVEIARSFPPGQRTLSLFLDGNLSSPHDVSFTVKTPAEQANERVSQTARDSAQGARDSATISFIALIISPAITIVALYLQHRHNQSTLKHMADQNLLASKSLKFAET